MNSEKISYKLDVFEGPLDLLLHLIEKNKLNIYDIRISELLEQYMEHIHLMQEQDLDVAGDFLTMASHLVQIKSAMLLPKYEEAEEMRKELSGQLIEYRKCKMIAGVLSELVSFDSFCREPEKIKADITYRRTHQPDYLIVAYLSAVGRGKAKIPPSQDAFSGIVARRIVSVSAKIVSVIGKLKDGSEKSYRSMFDNVTDKSDLVATFLAILELVKDKKVRIHGDGDDCKLMLISGDEGEKEWNEEN